MEEGVFDSDYRYGEWGNAAKIVKYRFDEDTISKLLKIRWWDFKEEEIVKIIPLLQSNNMEEFLRQYSK